MRLRSGAASRQGKKRSKNQDFFLVDDALGLYMVCDGMGSRPNSEIASRLAAMVTQDFCRNKVPNETVLVQALAAANTRIREHPDTATVASAVWIHPNSETYTCAVEYNRNAVDVFLAHAGDTRVYLFDTHDGVVLRLTTDHKTELMGFITTWLGDAYFNVDEVERSCVVLCEGMYLLLVSDGVYNRIRDSIGNIVFAILAQHPDDLNAAAAALLDVAVASGNTDDMTAVIVTVEF